MTNDQIVLEQHKAWYEDVKEKFQLSKNDVAYIDAIRSLILDDLRNRPVYLWGEEYIYTLDQIKEKTPKLSKEEILKSLRKVRCVWTPFGYSPEAIENTSDPTILNSSKETPLLMAVQTQDGRIKVEKMDSNLIWEG